MEWTSFRKEAGAVIGTGAVDPGSVRGVQNLLGHAVGVYLHNAVIGCGEFLAFETEHDTPAPAPARKHKKKNDKRAFNAVIGLIIALLVLGVVYYVYQKRKNGYTVT